MSVIITNVTPDFDERRDGVHQYILRINHRYIADFTHVREEGLAECLRRAAEAVDRQVKT